jgi:ribonuclease HI
MIGYSPLAQEMLSGKMLESIGHPTLIPAYRAELCGITSALFLLLWVCNGTDVEAVMIYCNSKTALSEVFKPSSTSNNPYTYLTLNINLMTCTWDLLLQLLIEMHIQKEWVKGHYQGTK